PSGVGLNLPKHGRNYPYNVGTDTANYQLMFEQFSEGYSWEGIEPGFFGLGWLLAALAPSIDIAVRAVALVFFGLIAWFVARSDHNERFLLLAYLLPAFAYQYSMNALRIGLASALLLLAVQVFRRKGDMPALCVGLLALLFHYSALFSLLFIALTQRPWLRLSTLLGLLVVLLGFAVGLIFIDFYLLEKIQAYQQLQAPGGLSGVSKVVPLVIMLAGMLLSSLPRQLKLKAFIVYSVFISAAWLLTQFSYAGLRFLDLLSFSVPLSILATYSHLQLDFDRQIKVSMLAAGLVSIAGIWRGFLLERGEGKSPFLPYEVLSVGWF
ncbi:EpsG family protein, partial [Halopseudomonas pelagia]|uniref:EpsG family protein n=1 Tax=Halopseudomonas pelagia TaxID=553151 RepID=UPI0030DA7F20